MVLKAPVSLRACSSLVQLLQLAQFRSRPAANTIQSWLLRLGLSELVRSKQKADDWLIIVDHTIQLGTMKCLLIVAVRQSAWSQCPGPLCLEDLEFVTLEPVCQSNGEVVLRQLRQAAEKLGCIKGILSDQGSDITGGTKKFQEESPSTLSFRDIAHATAIVLKNILLADPRWESFLKQCGQVQPKVKQTALGHLAPPSLKVKGRYMNLGPLVRWAGRMSKLLHKSPAERPGGAQLERLDEKFGWLTEYAADLDRWQALHQVKDLALEYGRNHGYHRQAARELEQVLKRVPPQPACDQMKSQIIAMVQEQSSQLPEHWSVPASSEVIESLIGKGKRIQGQHSRGGFTKMILGMAASVVKLTESRIIEALETVREADLWAWCREQLGQTLNSKRRAALPVLHRTESG